MNWTNFICLSAGSKLDLKYVVAIGVGYKWHHTDLVYIEAARE